jgi:hypothetical protein
VCVCETEAFSDKIVAVMCHHFLKNMHSDV